MADAAYTTSGTRTRTLLIIVAGMLFIGIWVAIYSFSKGSKSSKTVSPTSGIPNNIYVTPGSKSSEKYVELQQAANISGTKKAEAQGKTFIPTIIGNKADDLGNQFNNQLSDILKEKSNTQDYERLSKQLAELLAQFAKQGNDIDNLLRLIRELQNQGYNVEDLEKLLRKLMKDGYNADELARLLAQLKNQGYAINDLEAMLKKLLAQGYDPDMINKILEQLLKDRLKALQDAIKKLQDGGYNTTNKTYIQQVNNPDLAKLLEQLANQGYKIGSLEDLLKQLMDKGYNIFDMQVMLQQLQKDGYDVSKLQDLLNQLKKAGQDIKDLRSLLDALTKKNLAQQSNTTPTSNKETIGFPKDTKDPRDSGDSGNTRDTKDTKALLSNIFNSNKQNEHQPTEAEQKYAEIIHKQQQKALEAEKAKADEEKLRKMNEEKQSQRQQSMINSETRKKDMEAMFNNMNAEADSLTANSNKIPAQSFVRGEEIKDGSGQTTQTATEQPNINATAKLASKDKILKAGTILFAVLETSINSDEPGPILARIVQPPLQNTTMIGSVQAASSKYAEGLLLSFTTANIPDRIRSYGISAIAIDPNTARTAIATDVDHHYLLRWGTIFAATFLQGYSKAVAQSGTTVQSSSNGAQTNSTTTQSPLNPKQQIYQGIGDMATAWGQGISTFSNRPTTITIDAGTSLGILLTSDFNIPSSDETPTDQDTLTSQQIKTKANTNTIATAKTNPIEQPNVLPTTNEANINNTEINQAATAKTTTTNAKQQ